MVCGACKGTGIATILGRCADDVKGAPVERWSVRVERGTAVVGPRFTRMLVGEVKSRARWGGTEGGFAKRRMCWREGV